MDYLRKPANRTWNKKIKVLRKRERKQIHWNDDCRGYKLCHTLHVYNFEKIIKFYTKKLIFFLLYI